MVSKAVELQASAHQVRNELLSTDHVLGARQGCLGMQDGGRMESKGKLRCTKLRLVGLCSVLFHPAELERCMPHAVTRQSKRCLPAWG